MVMTVVVVVDVMGVMMVVMMGGVFDTSDHKVVDLVRGSYKEEIG